MVNISISDKGLNIHPIEKISKVLKIEIWNIYIIYTYINIKIIDLYR